MTIQAEGRYPVTEAEETTKDWIAYTVDCPECEEPAGFRCIYTTGPDSAVSAYRRPRSRLYGRPLRLRGDMTIRPHYVRSNLAARTAWLAAERARRAAERKAGPLPGSVWPNEETRKIRAALAARFDLAEYEQLRDWLREHGSILWGAVRPDGTRRGEPYFG